MRDEILLTIEQHFGELTDPRVDRAKLHRRIDILGIALSAVIAGRIIGKTLQILAERRWSDPRFFWSCRMAFHHTTTSTAYLPFWIHKNFAGGQVIAMDGKMLRRSHERWIGKAAINRVSAWASANRLVLAQMKVDDKSNEIAVLPQLLQALQVAGWIVTMDAIGCQIGIAKLFLDQ